MKKLNHALIIICILKIFGQCIEMNYENYFVTLNPEMQNIFKIAEKIINCCFNKRNVIFFSNNNKTPDESAVPYSTLTSETPITFFEIRKYSIREEQKRFRQVVKENETTVGRKNYPATDVVIFVGSKLSLLKLLQEKRSSIWWNSEAFFLIINVNVRSGCHNAKDFLESSWDFSLLSVIYLCSNHLNQLILYTFNPFTSLAPEFWHKIESDGQWTLFQRLLLNFDQSNCDCNTYFFDKTTNLNGYPIKAVLHPNQDLYRYNHTKKGYNRYLSFLLKIICTAFEYMNATVILKLSDNNGYVDAAGKPYGQVKDFMTKNVHCSLLPYFVGSFWRQQVYPFTSDSVRILTAKYPTNYLTYFTLIISLKMWNFVIFSSLVCIIILKYTFNQATFDAVIDFLRMLTWQRILKSFRYETVKILITVTLFVAFMINAIIQTRISAINTVPYYSPTIKSTEELVHSKIKISGVKAYEILAKHNKFLDRYFAITNLQECVALLLKGEHIACMALSTTLKYYLPKSSFFYISKFKIRDGSLVYNCAEDMPFLYKLSTILMKLSEGGFIKELEDLEFAHFKFPNLDYEDIEAQQDYADQRIFYFGFIIFLVGTITACFLFIIEIIILYMNKIVSFNI